MAWDAFVECGASPDHLLRLHHGEYTPDFVSYVVAFVGLKRAISNHVQDAVQKASQKGRKGGRGRKG